MRLARPLLCLTLLLAGCASAQPPTPALWRVSDADNSLYLLGSFHLLKPDDYPLSATVQAAFKDAETVLFELPPQEMGSPATAMAMSRAALRGDGKTLAEDIGPELDGKLGAWAAANSDALATSGLSAPLLQRLEPWFVALLISNIEMAKLGLDPALGLDAHFVAEAAKAGKPGAGLETAASQIALLDGMGKAEQLQFLTEALQDSRDAKRQTEAMHAAWRRGDDRTMWREMGLEMRRDYPALYRRINVERNDAWLPALQARLDAPGSDDTLVVVGALHLLGEDGVVAKLRAKGYKIERLK
jgi:uncharacterized protein YbaP (TraB family)